jgi:zinc protease
MYSPTLRILHPLLLAVLLAVGCLSARAESVHEYTLDNGLRVIVKEDHRAPVVVSQVWYKVGGSYEPAGKTGLSHVLEHMMFKGTENYPAGEFSRIMAANGASENAFTGTDFTAYYQVLEKSRLPISFELEADRMRNLRLNQDEFLKEREVVTEERRLRTEDKPESLAYERFMATAYHTSPYRNPIIGWMSDLRALELADLSDWYRQWYAPNNAIVVVVGDVEPEQVRALAERHFGPLPAQPPAKALAQAEIASLGLKRITVKRPAELPYLLMGYQTPSLCTINEAEQWEVYALEVLAWVLDGGDSARFKKYLERGQAIATSVSASYDLYSRLSGLFTFSGIPAQEKTVEELEQAIREQLRLAQETLVSQAELDRVKAQLVAGKVFERDSVFSQAYEIGSLAARGLDWRLKDDYLARITAITPEQVRAVARKYLQDDALTVAVLEPQPIGGEAMKE